MQMMMWTDDPVKDADAYDAECEARLKRRPVCDVCNEHIQDDHYYDIFGHIICPSCVDDRIEWIDED